ncbi:hypothetical protein M3Y94_00593600 [Aphelenchoides besseyi]|nr:hypothetical protein M3Y94_00593600 [Aphelenchoides besseyi]
MQAATTGIDEVTALEYGQLKVHYEILNKKFRAAQRAADQYHFYAKRQSDEIESILKTSNGTKPIPIKNVAAPIQNLSSRLTNWMSELDVAMEMEIQAAETINASAEYLKQGTSTDINVVSLFRKQRTNRFIIEHLLRNGYFETAQKLAEYVGAENCNKNVFHVAKQVEEALQRRDLSICLQWVMDNRSKLHRLHSKFEKEVRIQQLIDMINSGKRREAVSFLKAHFGGSRKWNKRLLNVMGLLAFGPKTDIGEYKKLVDDDRWNRMVELFREENAKIFKLSGHSAFSACLQVGIAAHKTPMCRHDPNSRCVVCRELFDLAEGLPFSHSPNSRLICAETGDQLDEENRPLMLSNGRVYGERAIRMMAEKQTGVIICPRTNETCQMKEIRKLYVL